MPSITISLSEELKEELKHFSWVNWSEIAREEVKKKLILEHFLKKGSITNAELEFCESIDWHPVDTLPLREEFVKQVKKAEKEPGRKISSLAELF